MKALLLTVLLNVAIYGSLEVIVNIEVNIYIPIVFMLNHKRKEIKL